MSGYAVASLEEIGEIDDGRAPYRPVRHHFGIEAFGVNTWTGQAGDRIVNEHDETDADVGDGQEELYFVYSGRARFELDGESVDAPAGTFVFVRPGVKRTAFAEESPTTIVTIGGTAGKAYEVFGWEVWFSELRKLYEAGDYVAVACRGRELVETHPYPGLAYNVACAESLAGEKESAIEHLRLAVEGSDALRELAATDSDFDAIRGEPGFKELLALGAVDQTSNG
jgi:mannose-6-phosphate isomerase-like protein (cupin superfamily)